MEKHLRKDERHGWKDHLDQRKTRYDLEWGDMAGMNLMVQKQISSNDRKQVIIKSIASFRTSNA